MSSNTTGMTFDHVDAGFFWNARASYLFSGTHYGKYSHFGAKHGSAAQKIKIDGGRPRDTSVWEDALKKAGLDLDWMSTGIDAAFANDYARAFYFFKGNQVLTFHTNNRDPLVPSHPQPITRVWPNIPAFLADGVDAVFQYPDGKKEYWFKGAYYARHKTRDDSFTDKQPISNWGNLPPEFESGIDAALRLDYNHFYWFKGDRYIRFGRNAIGADPGFVRPISDWFQPEGYTGNRGSYLRSGEFLRTGEYLLSENRGFYAIMQPDGNFSVNQGTGPDDNQGTLWDTGSKQSENPLDCFAKLQSDGHFCVYEGPDPRNNLGKLACRPHEAPGKGQQYFIKMQNDGNFCTYVESTPGHKQPGSPHIFCSGSTAVPQPPPAEPLTLQEVQEAIFRYGPVVHTHPQEKYHMSSVDWFFQRAKLCQKDSGCVPVDVDNLPTSTKGPRYWLDVDEQHYPGDSSTARAYVHALQTGGGRYTDLQFWFFYPFNGPGTVSFGGFETILDEAGRHVGDWEHVILRIANTTRELHSVYFSQHDSGKWVTDLDDLDRDDEKVVVYASRNGHASYPKRGANLSESETALGLVYGLANRTEANPHPLDCSNHHSIISAGYLGEDSPEEPHWLQFPYRYGPKENTEVTTKDVANILNKLSPLLSGAAPVITPIVKGLFGLVGEETDIEENGAPGPKAHPSVWRGGEG